jgi:hypothetical protein
MSCSRHFAKSISIDQAWDVRPSRPES